MFLDKSDSRFLIDGFAYHWVIRLARRVLASFFLPRLLPNYLNDIIFFVPSLVRDNHRKPEALARQC